jgi:hypothetical protein
MISTTAEMRSALADAQEHGVALRLESAGVLPADDTACREQLKATVLDAVHSALHGVALAQVDASEIVVRVGRPHDHKVAVDAHLKE